MARRAKQQVTEVTVKGKVIHYAGKERCDIVFALIQTAVAARKNVLAIDNSLTGDLFSIYSAGDQTDDVIEVENLVLARNRMPAEDKMREYDVTFVYSGLSTIKQAVTTWADTYVIAPGNEAEEVRRMTLITNYLNSLNDVQDFIVIQRDVTKDKKRTLPTIVKELGVQPSHTYVLSYDGYNYAAYVALTINGGEGLKGVSDDMCDLATELVSVVLQEDAKKIKQYQALCKVS